jgi:hypothetical protein
MLPRVMLRGSPFRYLFRDFPRVRPMGAGAIGVFHKMPPGASAQFVVRLQGSMVGLEPCQAKLGRRCNLKDPCITGRVTDELHDVLIYTVEPADP